MQNPTILFVEDDEGVRRSTAEVLAAHGFRMLVADSAKEALRLLAREKVDILFADIVMPGLNGIELARRAKHHHPGIKTILMTAYYSRAAEAQELADKLLFKPLRGPEIIAELDALLALA
jgi:two-component system, cell cycle response regulator CpdR